MHLSTATILSAAFVTTMAYAEPLPTDPSLVSGTLDNGLHYIIKKHATPPGRAAIWIHMHSGSLNESDQQRGLAHYLEHMAFNGSANFPPGNVVPFFQSLGMTFGRDQNAFTNFEQTTYQLALPDAKPETISKGMTFFSDVMYQLTLLPHEIEEERGIIQEERRRGLSGRQRIGFYILEHIAPGSIYGQRITIGTEATINAVKEQDFKDYYGKWYCASNATLMVVADTDPQTVVPIIKEKFGAAPKKPRPTPQNPGIKAYEKSFAIVASDPEVRSEDIQVERITPPRPPTTTTEQYRDDLVAALAMTALNTRLDQKIAKGGTALLSARASMGNDANIMWNVSMGGRAAPGKWREALGEIGLEWNRAAKFGFTSHEIETAKKEILSRVDRRVETEATMPASAVLGGLNGDITEGNTLMSAAQERDLTKSLIASITPEEAGKRFAKEFDSSAVAFVATLPSGGDVPTEAQLLEAGTAAFKVVPTAETEAKHATTLLAKPPTPGKITDMAEHAASAVTTAWLSNNVRVSYKFNDTRKNQVSVRVGLVGGEMFETAANRGITQAAQLAWRRQATKSLSSADISDLMAGKKVNVGGGGGMGGGRGGRGGGGGGGDPDTMNLSISGSPEDLETGFQLAYLLLTEPKIEEASFDQFKTTMKTALQESTKNPMMMGMRTVAAAPYPETEARTQVPTAEQIDAITVAAAQAWLDKLIATAPIEVAVVGDIPKEKAMDLVSRYIGALPKRDRVSDSLYVKERTMQRPKGPRTVEKDIDTATPQAFVTCGFYGCDDRNINDVRALNMAARVLSTRMIKEVREDAQLVYSIGASSRAASAYPGFGMFSAGAPTEPGKVDALVEKLGSMYQKFAKEGPTQEELDTAKKQMANTLDEQMKDPAYWMGRMEMMTYRAVNLDDVVNMPAAYQNLTVKQVQDTFAKYCTPENMLNIIVRPTSNKN